MHGLSFLAVLVLFHAWFGVCFASAPNSHVSNLIRADTKRKFLLEMGEIARFKRVSADCEAELSSKALPLSCFEKVDLELSNGFMSLKERDYGKERLNRICIERVKSVTLQIQLYEAIRSKQVSELCRSASRERLKDLRYQAETDAASRFFLESGLDLD